MPAAYLADTRVTVEGWGEKRKGSLFMKKQMMFCRELQELSKAAWEDRGWRKRGNSAQGPCSHWGGDHA